MTTVHDMKQLGGSVMCNISVKLSITFNDLSQSYKGPDGDGIFLSVHFMFCTFSHRYTDHATVSARCKIQPAASTGAV